MIGGTEAIGDNQRSKGVEPSQISIGDKHRDGHNLIRQHHSGQQDGKDDVFALELETGKAKSDKGRTEHRNNSQGNGVEQGVPNSSNKFHSNQGFPVIFKMSGNGNPNRRVSVELL